MRRWWEFCDDREMVETWDKYVCDLHFQDSDFILVDGKRNKKPLAIPSIKGEELGKKTEKLGLVKAESLKFENIKRDTLKVSPKLTIKPSVQKRSNEELVEPPIVSAQSVLDTTLTEPLKNISKNCNDIPYSNEKEMESTPVTERPEICVDLEKPVQRVKLPDIPKICSTNSSVKSSKNVMFTFDRQIVSVNIKDKKKFNTLATKNQSLNDNSNKRPIDCRNSVYSPVAIKRDKKMYTNKLHASGILKKQSIVCSSSKLSDQDYLTKSSQGLSRNQTRKVDLLSSESRLRNKPRTILPKPEIGTNSGVHILIPSSNVKNIDEIISCSSKEFQEPLNLSSQNCTTPSLNLIENATYGKSLLLRKSLGPISSKPVLNDDSVTNVLSSSPNKHFVLSSVIPKITGIVTMMSSNSNIKVIPDTSFSLGMSQVSSPNVFSNPSSIKTHEEELTSNNSTTFLKSTFKKTARLSKKMLLSKRVPKDEPTIKIKKQKFNNIRKKYEIVTDYQKRTLSKRYQRSSKKDIDLNNPKFSIAASAKSLDRFYTAPDNTLEEIDLQNRKWDKLFVSDKTIFSPTVLKTNTSAIIHRLRQKLPYLNERDKLEVKFLLNMMSMYPEAPDHLKEQLLERLNLVYVATLFTWETAISLAVNSNALPDHGNSENLL